MFKNITLKLMALAFSVALWFYVVGEKKAEVGLIVPLMLKNIPRDMMVIGEEKGEVEVRVTGPKTLVTDLSPTHIEVAIDLSNGRLGLNTYSINPQEIKTPRGVDVIRVSPTTVKVRLEKTRSQGG